MAAEQSTQDQANPLRRYLHNLLPENQRLIVASNRGPLTFRHDRTGKWHVRRGSGGLVTALAEVGRLAPVTWVSAAMDQADRDAARLLYGSDGQKDELAARVRAIADKYPLYQHLS